MKEEESGSRGFGQRQETQERANESFGKRDGGSDCGSDSEDIRGSRRQTSQSSASVPVDMSISSEQKSKQEVDKQKIVKRGIKIDSNTNSYSSPMHFSNPLSSSESPSPQA